MMRSGRSGRKERSPGSNFDVVAWFFSFLTEPPETTRRPRYSYVRTYASCAGRWQYLFLLLLSLSLSVFFFCSCVIGLLGFFFLFVIRIHTHTEQSRDEIKAKWGEEKNQKRGDKEEETSLSIFLLSCCCIPSDAVHFFAFSLFLLFFFLSRTTEIIYQGKISLSQLGGRKG